jgi:hypothetical protein
MFAGHHFALEELRPARALHSEVFHGAFTSLSLKQLAKRNYRQLPG